MRKLLTVGAMIAGLSAMGLAETWSGVLLDANCANRHNTSKSCDAKRSSSAYVLDVNGTRHKLDAKSNDTVRRAMDSRADRASNPDATKAVPVNATIVGHLGKSGRIHANRVELQ